MKKSYVLLHLPFILKYHSYNQLATFLHLSIDIILQLNRTARNETSVTDEKDLARKIAEVESMLREMRFKGFDFQKRLAENELEQANKCE